MIKRLGLALLAAGLLSGQSVLTSSEDQARSYLVFMAQERGCVLAGPIGFDQVDDGVAAVAVYDCSGPAPAFAIAA